MQNAAEMQAVPGQERRLEFSQREIGLQSLRVGYWPAEGKTTQPPILYFAGIGTRLEEVIPLANRFPDREFVSFDMPGIGGSPQPMLPYTIGAVACMAADLLKELEIETVDIVGLSWGGAVAQQFAVQHAGLVRRMVLKATSTGMLSVPGDVTALGQEISSGFELPSVAGFGYQLMALGGWTSAPFLPFLDKPTLIMMGTRDTVVPMANGHILRLLIPGSQLCKVKGGGHMFAQTHLDQTAAEMRRFLDDASG